MDNKEVIKMKIGTKVVKEVTLYRIRVFTLAKSGRRKGLVATALDRMYNIFSGDDPTVYEYYKSSELASIAERNRSASRGRPAQCFMLKFSDGSYVEIYDIAEKKT